MTRHSLRLTAIAALTALAGFGAHASEATQWDPHSDRSSASEASTSRTQTAWATDLGEATQFHDAMTHETMARRAEVRSDFKMARSRGLLNDTGEGGATERVLARREAYVHEEHDRLVALNTPAPDEDQIGEMIAAMAPADTWLPDSFASMSSPEFMPEDVALRLPTDQQDPYSIREPSVIAMAPMEDEYWR